MSDARRKIATSKEPPAVSSKKKAKYFKASGRLKSDSWEEISKNAYKELLNWCAAEHVKLPIRDVFVAYEYEGADEEYVAPMGSVISANEMAAHVLGIAPQPKSISAPSAATPAVTTGETSSSAHHEPVHVAKDSLPVVTSTEDQSQRPATMCAGTVPNVDIPARLRSPGAESAVSLGEEDEDLCSFGSLATPSAPAKDIPFSPLPSTLTLRPSSPGISVPPPTSSTAAEAVGSQNARNHRTYQGKSDHSWHHGRDASHGTYPRSYATSSSSRLTLPHRRERSAFLDGHSSSSRKRTISSVSSPSRAEANKRLQMAAPPTFSRPTLMNRLHDVDTFPAASPPTLMERIHDVATFPVASPPAPEPSPPQQLQPAQVQTLPVTAEVGLSLIAEYYQADELQIDGPAFMTGITIPVAPVLRSGRLTTTFRSAIRVVYDKLLHPNGSPADSIQTLLRSGAPFRVLVPLANTVPHQLAVAPSYLSRRNLFQGFDLTNPGFWNKYTSRVRELLRHPFARRFLTLGGILWRIALQFGPNTLVQEALAGPSLAVTLWRSGESVGNLWDDYVTPEEIKTLLGHSYSGSESCWPPIDIWDSSKKWTGFWSDADEAWFQSHLANLSSGNLQAPKSRRTWKTCFRPAKSDAPSEIYAQELFTKLGHDNTQAPTWDL